MRVAITLARASARDRLGPLVGLAFLVALGLAVSVAAVDLAARTEDAYPRYLERSDVGDLVVNPSLSSERAADLIEGIDGVRRVTTDDVLTATFDDGTPRPQSEVDSGTVQVRMSSDGRYEEQDRPVVLEGRMVRSGREAFVNQEVAEAEGLAVGDELPIAFWMTSYNTPGVGPAQDDLVQPLGRSSATVVGIGLLADELLRDGLYPRQRVIVTEEVGGPYTCTLGLFDDLDGLTLEEVFARVVPTNCALSYRYFSLVVDGGAAGATRVADDLNAAFVAENEQLPALLREQDVGYVVIPSFTSDEADKVDRALRPAVTALRAFGVGAAAATLVLVALLAVRSVRRDQADAEQWRQLGASRAQRRLALVAPRALAVIVGGVIAGAVVTLATGVEPIGSAAVLARPDRLAWVEDGGIVLAVALALMLGVTVLTASLGLAAQRPRADRPTVTARLAQLLHPARSMGVRAATRGSGAAAVLAGSAAAVAVIIASLVFSANVGQLAREPERYGWSYDSAVLIGFGYGGADIDVIAEALDRPEVERVELASLGSVVADGNTLPAVAARRDLDPFTPPIVRGALPTADDEIAVGRETLAELDLDVGDQVTLSSYFGERRGTVTGVVVLPALGPYGSDRASSGEGVFMSAAFFDALAAQGEEAAGIPPGSISSTVTSFVGIDLADGVDAAALLGSLDLLAWDSNGFSSPTYVDPIRPSALEELSSVRSIPFALGGAFGAAMATGLVLGITMSVRGRRHELWILRALGADGRQRGRTVRWHALTVVVVALVLGGPLGVAVGRSTARAFIDDLGVVPGLVLPAGWLVAVGAGTLAIGFLAALGPAWQAAHRLTAGRPPD